VAKWQSGKMAKWANGQRPSFFSATNIAPLHFLSRHPERSHLQYLSKGQKERKKTKPSIPITLQKVRLLLNLAPALVP
jgi:hypothetical protein